MQTEGKKQTADGGHFNHSCGTFEEFSCPYALFSHFLSQNA